MERFALVKDGAIVEYRDLDPATVPNPANVAAHKPRLFPVVEEETGSGPVRSGPTITVEASRVLWLFTLRAHTEEELQSFRDKVAFEIEAEFQRRWQLPIDFAVGGVTYEWHADQDAVANISGVVLMIAAGVPVPNPRPWTPRGSHEPVDISHAELIGLGAAIAGRKDALFAAKKQKQAAVAELTDADAILSYDVTAGWD